MKTLLLLFILTSNVIFSQLDQSRRKSEKYSLTKCIEIAVKNNPKLKIVKFGENIVEKQIEQIKSANYPQVNLNLIAVTLNKDPNFIFPSFKMDVPPINLGNLQLESEPITVPEQNVKLMDKFSFLGSIDMQYALWTGGYVKALSNQAETGLKISRLKSEKTKIDLIAEVKKRFYTVKLLIKLLNVADNTYQTLNSALKLSEKVYEGGSGTVTRTDYLKNSMYTQFFATVKLEIGSKLKLAKAALLNSMSFPSDYKFEIIYSDSLKSGRSIQNYHEISNKSFAYNPLWRLANDSKKVFEFKLDEIKSEYLPKFGIFAGYQGIYNNYDFGIVSSVNSSQWHVGLGMEMSIFNGFRTSNKMAEQKIKILQLKEQINELHNGLDILAFKATENVNSELNKLKKLKKLESIAKENREIIERAYNNDLVETKDLIEAQMYESFVLSQLYTSEYNYSIAEVELENVIGKRKNAN